MFKFFKSEKGFTLVELMVVVLIIGILMAIAIPVFTSASKRASQRSCFASITTLERAYEQYKADQEGAVVAPADSAASTANFTALQSLIVPTYVKTAPVCKSGGDYEAAWAAGAVTIDCSAHGTQATPTTPLP